MFLGQRSKSQSSFKICVFQNRVQPKTSSCMVGFKNYLAELIITRRYVASKNISLGHWSRSQPVKVCAFQIHVRPKFLSYMVEFENYLEEMINKTR